MFELIFTVVRYFTGDIKDRRRICYRFRPPLSSLHQADATSILQ